MKKKLKLIIFTLLFAFICPVVFFGCDEVTFDSVPYTSSSASIEDVVVEFNSSAEYMVNNIKLKSEYETVNTYTFYNSRTCTNKVVRDVIITTLGSINNSPIITKVEKTRYVDNKKETNTVDTYIQSTSGDARTQYCYTSVTNYTGEEAVNYKDRKEYNSGIQDTLSFYKSAIYEIKLSEVASIQEKQFENVTYYKLNSGVNTLENVNNRFVEEKEDNKLFDNPELFKLCTKAHHDACEDFYYECAKNGSNYASYFKIGYNLKNIEEETYLNVTSVTKLKSYGENLEIELPEDFNEYTASNFMNTLKENGSYVTYTTTPQEDGTQNPTLSSRVTWTVAKMGNDYSIRKVEYQSGSQAKTTLYYLVSTTETNYNAYVLNDDNKLSVATDVNLDFLEFNFNQRLTNKFEDSYTFGEEKESVVITFKDDKIYSATTKNTRNDNVVLFIEDYGDDYTKLQTTFITSPEDYA